MTAPNALASSGTVTRFAPSPTGFLHIGHAYAAFVAAEAAGAHGRFLLRIEDIDTGRCRAEFETALHEDLVWLGLTWDEPVRRQSQHFSDYRSALARLEQAGLLYPCFCTRAEIQREVARAATAPHGRSPAAASGPDGPLYPGTCKTLSVTARTEMITAGRGYALRLDMDAAVTHAFANGPLTWTDESAGEIHANPEVFGDVVLARKDVPASYHLACTLDDALQGVTLVTRGEDLFTATHVHRLLQALLDLPTPRYCHHRLLLDASGKKFSKRDQAPTLRSLRAAGRTPADVRAMIEGLAS